MGRRMIKWKQAQVVKRSQIITIGLNDLTIVKWAYMIAINKGNYRSPQKEKIVHIAVMFQWWKEVEFDWRKRKQ